MKNKSNSSQNSKLTVVWEKQRKSEVKLYQGEKSQTFQKMLYVMEYSQTTTADFASLLSTKTLRYGDKIILGQKEKEVCKHEEVANLFNNIASVFNSYFYQGSFYGCLLVSFL